MWPISTLSGDLFSISSASFWLLGYDPLIHYTGRAPIEAASLGIPIPDGKIAFRCNLTTWESGLMKSFTADHISTEEADLILKELNKVLDPDVCVFYTGVSYRHIAILDEKYLSVVCTPPHDLTDKPVEPGLPKGQEAPKLHALMAQAHKLLENHPVNQKRLSEGKLPASDIWLWGQGKPTSLPSFSQKYGFGGGIVTAVDLLKGLGQLSGLQTPFVPGATGFLDTNYAGKIAAALKILEHDDFVFIHIEAPDEAGHMGEPLLKKQAIEDFDAQVIGPMVAFQNTHPNVRILVLPDHPTPCDLKTHSHDPVPFIMAGHGLDQAHAAQYSERHVSQKHFFETPWALLEKFFS